MSGMFVCFCGNTSNVLRRQQPKVSSIGRTLQIRYSAPSQVPLWSNSQYPPQVDKHVEYRAIKRHCACIAGLLDSPSMIILLFLSNIMPFRHFSTEKADKARNLTHTCCPCLQEYLSACSPRQFAKPPVSSHCWTFISPLTVYTVNEHLLCHLPAGPASAFGL